jgi:hypothetical protein
MSYLPPELSDCLKVSSTCLEILKQQNRIQYMKDIKTLWDVDLTGASTISLDILEIHWRVTISSSVYLFPLAHRKPLALPKWAPFFISLSILHLFFFLECLSAYSLTLMMDAIYFSETPVKVHDYFKLQRMVSFTCNSSEPHS